MTTTKTEELTKAAQMAMVVLQHYIHGGSEYRKPAEAAIAALNRALTQRQEAQTARVLCAGCGKVACYESVKSCKTPDRCGTLGKTAPQQATPEPTCMHPSWSVDQAGKCTACGKPDAPSPHSRPSRTK